MWPFKNKRHSIEIKQTQHHYALAHIVLRQRCFNDPIAFFLIMASPKQQEYMEKLWAYVRLQCDGMGMANFAIQEVKIDYFHFKGYPALLITMPPPQFTAEAYMVLIVLKIPIEKLDLQSEDAKVGYYTLEKGINAMTAGDRTVLCEWSGESHLNYGNGPEPTSQSFINAVTGIV